MTAGVRRWRDTDHLSRAVETAGGPEAFGNMTGRHGESLGDIRPYGGLQPSQPTPPAHGARLAGAAPPVPDAQLEVLEVPSCAQEVHHDDLQRGAAGSAQG